MFLQKYLQGRFGLKQLPEVNGKMNLSNRLSKIATNLGILCFVALLIASCGSSPTPASLHPTGKQATPSSPDNNERLYMNTPQYGLTKLRAQDGKKLWQWPTNKADIDAGATPVVSNGLVYIASATLGTAGTGTIYAIDSKTGKTKWSVPFDSAVTFIVDGSTMYVSSDGSAFALDALTGHALWRKDVIATISAPDGFSMSFVNNNVLYAHFNDTIYAFNTSDGAIQWHQSATDLVKVVTLGALRDLKLVGNILIAMISEGFIGMDPNDGHKIWFDNVEQKGYTIDISKHLLYLMLSFGMNILQNQTGLTAIKTDDGSVAWSSNFPIDKNINGPLPMGFSSSAAYLGQATQDGIQQVYAFSLQDGHPLWTADASPATNGISTSATADRIETIIVGTHSDTDQLYTIMDDGIVYAFTMTTGKQIWSISSGVKNILIGNAAHNGGNDLFTSLSDSSSSHSFLGLVNSQTGKIGWKQNVQIYNYANIVFVQE